MVQAGQRGVGLPSGTVPHSLPTPSPNLSVRDVAASLTHFGTTALVLGMPLVDLMVPPLDSPSKPQSTPLQPLLCGVYLPPKTFALPLLGYVPFSSCGMIGSGDLLSLQ